MSNCVYKHDCEIEVLARLSKNGASGQNALYRVLKCDVTLS